MLEAVKGKNHSAHFVYRGLRVVADSQSSLPGFTAAYALAFCAGVYLRGALAWWLPLVVMMRVYRHRTVLIITSIHSDLSLLLNYAIYAGLIAMGKWFRQNAPFWKLVFGGILGAAIFYLLTNTSVMAN